MPEDRQALALRASRPKVLGIAGGSCSGKTTLSELVLAALGPERSMIIRTDNYYRPEIAAARGGQVNFDLPSAVDFDRLHADLQVLKTGRPVDAPLWDFVTHRRRAETMRCEPREVILVEGIFALHPRQLTELYDHSCYIECPEAIRLDRRIARDVAERGRTEWSVREQFESQVAPMHDEYIEPTKHMAARIVSQSEYCANAVAVAAELVSVVLAAPSGAEITGGRPSR